MGIVHKRKNRLKNINVDEVSFCKQGMNQKALILIHKSKEEAVETPLQMFRKALGNALRIVATGKDAEGNVLKSEDEQLAGIDTELTAITKALDSEVPESLEKTAKTKKKILADNEDLLDSGDDEELEKSFDAVTAIALQKAQDEATELKKSVADLSLEVTTLKKASERAELRKSVTDLTGNLPANVEEVADIMSSLDVAGRAKFEKVLKAANAVAASALLTSTIGRSEAKPGSPEAKLDELAKARAKETHVSFAKAYAEVLDTNQELYAEVMSARGFQR